MNIFTKTTISILILGITQSVFSQQLMHKDYQKVPIPFYDGDAVRAAILKQQPSSDTIWLPASGFWTGGKNGNEYLISRELYEYHEDGLLKRFTSYHGYTGEMEEYSDYNNTYRDPLMDIPDTIFRSGFTDPETGEYYPPHRYYYNNRQADSSYWEEYYQVWDGDKWDTRKKTYVHLLDTATVSELQDHVQEEYFTGGAHFVDGWKAFFDFDEQGKVTGAIIELYNAASQQYKIAAKNVYLYDDEGKCHTWEQYVYSAGTWNLFMKLTNIKWFKFHGFDNGDVLFFSHLLGLYPETPKKNKNKVSSVEPWETYQGTLIFGGSDTIKWEPDLYSYDAGHYSPVGCIMHREYKNYNEHEHITAQRWSSYDKYYIAPCDTDLQPVNYIFDDYINKYDERGRHYEYIQNQTVHLYEWDSDSIWHSIHIYTIDSFTYVGCPVGIDEFSLAQSPLSIVPNPSDETVRITAADSIATITLYTSDGRLAYTQEGGGKEIILNLQGVAKGVYIVKALLKNGKIQTGKMVAR